MVFLIFGSLKNNLMKVYLVPNSIVNYTKFVSSKLLIYFVISNGKGCKHAQARVFWAWQVSLKTHQEVLLDMFLSWAIAQGYISLLTFSCDQFFCNKYLFGLFFGVCVLSFPLPWCQCFSTIKKLFKRLSWYFSL